jgi:hypothetical protein
VPQLGRNNTLLHRWTVPLLCDNTDEDDRKAALRACDGTDTGRIDISQLTPLPEGNAALCGAARLKQQARLCDGPTLLSTPVVDAASAAASTGARRITHRSDARGFVLPQSKAFCDLWERIR